VNLVNYQLPTDLEKMITDDILTQLISCIDMKHSLSVIVSCIECVGNILVRTKLMENGARLK